MRDLDRWKDKVEISLDGRQIFFLFFGTAVAACLIFVVGVLLGKRIEARALALQPAPLEDPLAALDQLGDADEADEGLTFHKALTPPRPDKPVIEAKKVEPKKAETKKPELKKLEVKALDEVADDDVKPEAKSDAKSDARSDAKSDAKPEAKNDAKPIGAAANAKPPVLPAARAQVVQQSAPAVSAKKPDATTPHFTLQLSAFPDKSDAEDFMHKIQAAGYKPFLVSSEIPGKGLFFRVRVGDYASRQAAVEAKGEFERKQRIIAYVAKL
jgi:cell division septation protein DedD